MAQTTIFHLAQPLQTFHFPQLIPGTYTGHASWKIPSLHFGVFEFYVFSDYITSSFFIPSLISQDNYLLNTYSLSAEECGRVLNGEQSRPGPCTHGGRIFLTVSAIFPPDSDFLTSHSPLAIFPDWASCFSFWEIWSLCIPLVWYLCHSLLFLNSIFFIRPWAAHGKEEVFSSIDFPTMPGTVLDNQTIGRVLISNLSITPENWVSKDDPKRVTKWVQVYPTVFKAHFWCIFLWYTWQTADFLCPKRIISLPKDDNIFRNMYWILILKTLKYTVASGIKLITTLVFSLHKNHSSLKISVNNKMVFFFLFSCMLMHYSLRKEHMPHSHISNAMVTVGLFLCRFTFQRSRDIFLPVKPSIVFLYWFILGKWILLDSLQKSYSFL